MFHVKILVVSVKYKDSLMTKPNFQCQFLVGLGTTATLESCLRRYLRSTKIRFVSRSLHGQVRSKTATFIQSMALNPKMVAEYYQCILDLVTNRLAKKY